MINNKAILLSADLQWVQKHSQRAKQCKCRQKPLFFLNFWQVFACEEKHLLSPACLYLQDGTGLFHMRSRTQKNAWHVWISVICDPRRTSPPSHPEPPSPLCRHLSASHAVVLGFLQPPPTAVIRQLIPGQTSVVYWLTLGCVYKRPYKHTHTQVFFRTSDS